MTHIKDLIEIPDHVGRGDFVLRLSEGITDPENTVKYYQVTPQLVECFDQALNLVKSALLGIGGRSTSKAAYLHGSFGSGKSHFMAILHLILSGNSHARSIPELAGVIAKHNEWTAGKKFLMVPYHLMNARNLESAILGGYADYIARTHPQAPTPSLYLAEGLLANAELIRQGMGDTKFFEGLNKGKGNGTSGWGSLNATWDAVSYTTALRSAHNSEPCRRLVRDLVETHFPAMKNTEEFVDLDDGLAVISAHAKEIGYDAVVLFLDELILWLASRAGDQNFISREGNKVVKLVESTRADRPAPLVSFIARQRDLRDLIGQHVAGAEKLAFSDVLSHQGGRFGVINLEDRNLPAIAAKRILLPKSAAAKALMDGEFERTRQLRGEIMKSLLTSDANRDDFRKLYPFSPALVETLVAVSSLLQRERTALKVMALLLSEQKETLRLGQIVPVGDLYDQVSQGDEAFSSGMKIHFDNANRLYQGHLKPLLERTHGITFAEAKQLPYDDPKRRSQRNDDRLIKTLLLAALVPEVEALKNMTPQKLAALNHGSITSPIPGQEASTVLTKFKGWAAEAGQIKIREGAGQTMLSLQLSSVDTEQILARADNVDNRGNRIAKLKEFVFKGLGQDNPDNLFCHHEFKWRGTPRKVEILFGNVRELPLESLSATGDGWKIVIDYPFDPQGHGVRDDIAKIESFSAGGRTSRTICWLASFFNHDTLQALGNFVKLEQILKDNQFPSYVTHLTETDRETARNQLESQREQLRSQLTVRIEMAYGIRPGGEGYLDEPNTLEPHEHFRSLSPAITFQPPVAANLEQGLTGLLDQALRQQFPAHPEFHERISLTKASLSKVLEVVKLAVQSTEPSILVDTALRRQVADVANPLKLGNMTEQRFQLSQHWKNHFLRQIAQNPGDVSVSRLREWTNKPEPMGLPEILSDLIIFTFAEQTNRVFKLHGGPANPELDSLEDAMVLVEVALPSEADWNNARNRTSAIFGLPISPLLNATNVSSLSDQVRAKVAAYLPPLQALIPRLQTLQNTRFPQGSGTRLKTAREGLAFLQDLSQATGNSLVAKMSGVSLQSNPAVLAVTVTTADRLSQALETTEWDIFDGLSQMRDDRKTAAEQIGQELADAFHSDEHAVSLLPKLTELRRRGMALLTRPVAAPPSAPVPYSPPPVPAAALAAPASAVSAPMTPAVLSKPAQQLKTLYQASQVQGDELPAWLPAEAKLQLLRVHRFGPNDQWSSHVVLTPLLEALVQLDPQARVDLPGGKLILPGFRKELDLTVKAEHLTS